MNYRDLISEEFVSRCQKNRAYSARAFARDLGISPALYSRVMNGDRHFTDDRAVQIAEMLRWSKEKTELFSHLVRFARASTDQTKNYLQNKIDRLRAAEGTFPLRNDVFSYISEWHHIAILELAELDGFQYSPALVAEKLGISLVQAEVAFDRLVRLGLLERSSDGSLCKANETLSFGEVPSGAVRKYHGQILDLAKGAIDKHAIDERDFSSITMAVDPETLALAKERIREFHREMMEFLQKKSKKKSALYQLAIQFFRLDRSKN